MADLGLGSGDENARPANHSSLGKRRLIGTYGRVGIGITVIAVIFMAFAYYSKNSHLENVRRKCVATFELQNRCDCIVSEISRNTYAVSFVPMLRLLSGLSPQKLAGIIREAAMACVEPR